MTKVTIRDLRNHGGEVVARVASGETVTVTRAGTPVAELRPMRVPGLMAEVLLDHWRRLPRIDAGKLRSDLDSTIDPTL